MPTLAPTSLRGAPAGLEIAWPDGLSRRIGWDRLRAACPCATCKVAREEPPALLPVLAAGTAQSLRASGLQLVGNYALQIDFSDGHNSGIYTFDLLRTLTEEAAPTP